MLNMALHLTLFQHVYEFTLTLWVICVIVSLIEVGLCILIGELRELAKDADDLLVAVILIHALIVPHTPPHHKHNK